MARFSYSYRKQTRIQNLNRHEETQHKAGLHGPNLYYRGARPRRAVPTEIDRQEWHLTGSISGWPTTAQTPSPACGRATEPCSLPIPLEEVPSALPWMRWAVSGWQTSAAIRFPLLVSSRARPPPGSWITWSPGRAFLHSPQRSFSHRSVAKNRTAELGFSTPLGSEQHLQKSNGLSASLPRASGFSPDQTMDLPNSFFRSGGLLSP